jgi:alpha-tubulin suppressor-like RCC1 family protein
MILSAMTKQSKLALSMALILGAGLSCNEITAPATTGGIDIVLTSSPGGNLLVVPRDATEPDVNLSMVSPNPQNVLLDGVRVTVNGPTNKSVLVTTDADSDGFFEVTVDGLDPGTYTVVVEGLVGGLVGHYGETTNVVVTAGNTTSAPITFPKFQPVVPNLTVTDTVEVLRFTVAYSAVPNADSYVVAWSTSPTMSGAQTRNVTTTSTEVSVPAEGKYYFTVRAVSNDASAAGLPSVPKSVQVFQSVVSVVVTPSTPSITAGQTVQFSFEARDGDNVVVVNPPVVWISNNHNVATISPTGLATSITSGTATITAAAKGTPGIATLTATPMAASKLVFTQQPPNTTAGVAIAEVKVAIQNQQNQTNTNDDVTQITITIANNAGGGTLGGTATATVVDGVATFSTLNINKTGTGYTLTAAPTSGTLTSATSTGFNITPASADRLAFIIPPSNITAGAPISPAVQVEVRDALGNRAVGSSAPVTLGIGTNPSSGTLSGTKTVNAINGVASFSGLSVDKVGTGYTLTATSGSLTAALPSDAFAISAGPASRVAFTSQPSSGTADDLISVGVAVHDAFGNVVTAAVDVTVSLATNPGGATLTGNLTQTTSGGTVTFNDLHVNRVADGYSFIATSPPALTSATTSTFNVSHGAAHHMKFVSHPQTAEPTGLLSNVQVAVQDQHNNQVSTDGIDVVVVLDNNPTGANMTGNQVQPTVNLSGNGYTLATGGSGLDPDFAGQAFDVALEFTSFGFGNFAGCGITTTGSAYCHGWGGFGELGDGTFATDIPFPRRVTGGHTFSSIGISGGRHACAIRTSDSQALCWGQGGSGRLGNGGTANSNVPVLVTGDIAFSRVSVGVSHTCAIRADNGQVMCWGAAANGRLGNNTTTPNALTPVFTNDAEPYVWISAGNAHTCGIRASDRRVLCWGAAGSGRLGNNTTTPDVLVPTLTTDASQYATVSAGQSHTCGIRTNSVALCWGFNGTGQLGNGGFVEALNPTGVSGALRFSQIRAGAEETCGVALDGVGFCWGNASFGRLGNGTETNPAATPGGFATPQVVLGGHRFTAVTPNHVFGTCGIAADGVYCWGNNGNAQSGNGTVGVNSSVPTKVVGTR